MSDTTRAQTPPKTPEELTADVLASFDETQDARLREIMQALVRHLHGFVLEVGLTPQEWEEAIGTLTRTGHITDERRQEFILWSDSLGVSMLVDAIENTVPPGATESTVQGPFYVPGSPLRAFGESEGFSTTIAYTENSRCTRCTFSPKRCSSSLRTATNWGPVSSTARPR